MSLKKSKYNNKIYTLRELGKIAEKINADKPEPLDHLRYEDFRKNMIGKKIKLKDLSAFNIAERPLITAEQRMFGRKVVTISECPAWNYFYIEESDISEVPFIWQWVE